jgi:DnaK suppressor protein
MQRLEPDDDEKPLLQEPLSPEEIRSFHDKLRGLLSSLQGDVARIESDYLAPSGAERGQPDDESSEEAAIELELDRLVAEDGLGYRVNDALERIREGTFGLCESCGEWISRERLRLVPYAEVCPRCLRRGELGAAE